MDKIGTERIARSQNATMTVDGAIQSGIGVPALPGGVGVRGEQSGGGDGPPMSFDTDRLTLAWAQTAGRAFKVGGTLTLVANVCVSVTLLLSEPVPASATTAAAALLAALSQVVLAVAFLRGSSRVPLACGLAVATGAVLVLAAVNPGDQADRQWWPTNIALSTVAFLVFARPGPVGRWLGLLVAGASVLTDFWRLIPGTGLTRIILDATQTATTAAYVILFAHALNRAIGTANQSVQSAAAAVAAVAVEQGRGRRARDFERFIHDKVIDTLHAIAMDRTIVDSRSAQRLAAELKSRLDDFMVIASTLHGTRDLRGAIREVAEGAHLTVTVRGRSRVQVDVGVVTAMAAATAEALRNVVRHSGATHAVVLVRRDGPGARVVIRDRGHGFDPTNIPAHRHGLRSSIHERMADVHGVAQVTSSPGDGTTVSLVWRPLSRPGGTTSGAETAHGVMTPALRDFARVMTPTFWWVAIAMALLAHTLIHPWIAVVPSVAVLAVGAFYWQRALRVGLSGLDHLGLAVIAVVASVANGLALAPGETDMAKYWLAGGSTALVLLCILLRPMRETVWSGVIVAVTPLVTLMSMDGGRFRAHTLPAVIAAPLAISCGFAVRVLIDRFTVWLARTEDAVARDWARERLMESSRLQVTVRALEISELTGPLITAIAEGFRDPGDPRIREEAAKLEQWLRDDLALKDLPRTRDAVRSARRAGWDLTVRRAQVTGAALDDLTARLVGALGHGDAPGRLPKRGKVELTLRPAGRRGIVSAIVHRAPERVVESLLEFGNTSGTTVVAEPGYVHLRGSVHDSVLQ